MEERAHGVRPDAGPVREDEHGSGPAARAPPARHDGDVRLAAQEGAEGADGLVPPGDDDRQSVLEVGRAAPAE